MGKDLSDRRVRVVAPDDRVPHSYFVFADGHLLTAATGSTHAEVVAETPDIGELGYSPGDGRLKGKELEIRLHVHGPWVCVTERFGVRATLINTTTGAVRGLRRADYHSDVSSYSIGFLDRDGRTLLVAQTQWNRLDVFDAETGENLTEREVSIRDSGRLLVDLDVARSHSRPHVSNDNPFSEAAFKTLKYCPAFPDHFEDIEHARAFCKEFFDYYTRVTPIVHEGRTARHGD